MGHPANVNAMDMLHVCDSFSPQKSVAEVESVRRMSSRIESVTCGYKIFWRVQRIKVPGGGRSYSKWSSRWGSVMGGLS